MWRFRHAATPHFTESGSQRGGYFEVGVNRYPKAQLWSIADYFQDRLPVLPPLADPYTGKAMQYDLSQVEARCKLRRQRIASVVGFGTALARSSLAARIYSPACARASPEPYLADADVFFTRLPARAPPVARLVKVESRNLRGVAGTTIPLRCGPPVCRRGVRPQYLLPGH